MQPHIIELNSIGSNEIGFISVAEGTSLPFNVERVYWTYSTPENLERGNHAHKNLEQLIIAVHGTIEMELESIDGQKKKYILDNPAKALYIPSYYWRRIRFFDNALLLCLASKTFNKEDYIRDYQEFLELKNEI